MDATDHRCWQALPGASDPARAAARPVTDTGITVAGARYWAALCAASLLGADLGDLLAHDLHLGHWIGVPPLLLLICGALLLDKRAGTAAGIWFWMAVVLVRTVATNLADLADHDWHLSPLLLVVLLCTGLLVAGRHATPRRPGTRFWIALFLAGTAGTVLGDAASDRFGLAIASAALSALAGLALLATSGRDQARPYRYWPLVLLIRTAGTSVADLLAGRSGLGLAGSTVLVAAVLAAVLLARRPSSAIASA